MSREELSETFKQHLGKVLKYVRENVFTATNREKLITFLHDLQKSLMRVVFGTRMPDKKGWSDFLLQQVIINGSSWTAGVLAGDLVGSYFKTRSAKNLWGLKGRNDGRTTITKEEYEMYSWWASYLCGLLILLLVRHIVLRTIEEFKKIRTERKHSQYEKNNT